MIKRKSNVQNVIIIILCILLLISIGFGVTYSYYNGKSNLVKGTITTANLSISLSPEDEFGQTTGFEISAPPGEKYLVPGNGLCNVELNLVNKCNQETYMVVVYSLSASKIDDSKDVSDQLKNMPAISFNNKVFESGVWKQITYNCTQVTGRSYTCLVGINPFAPRTDDKGNKINVLPADSIKIPEQWNDTLQNCNVTISVTAYAIQSKNLGAEYAEAILNAQEANNMEAKAQAIAKATLEICKVDHVDAQ